MADNYDPFGLRKNKAGYVAELIQEGEGDVARTFAKNHAYDGGILSKLEQNPGGWGDSPLPVDPVHPHAELTSNTEGGGAFKERPKDPLTPAYEGASPAVGAYGMGQGIGEVAKDLGEGEYANAAWAAAPLAIGALVPGPDGGVGKKIPTAREIDARGFYSPSLEASKGLGQETGTVQQFRSMLLKAGGKPKELEAVGFHKAFPDPNAKVSRADIEQYLRDNRVKLGEVRKASDFPDSVRESGQYDQWRDQFDGPAKFEDYSTPGGIPGSYREVVTTLPGAPESMGPLLAKKQRGEITQADYDAAKAAKENAYTSSHWPGITNPVLHYRTKDFETGRLVDVSPEHKARTDQALEAYNRASIVDPNRSKAHSDWSELSSAPAKTRVLDEMQSDWAQRARDQGLNDPAAAAQLKAEREAAEAEINTIQRQAMDYAHAQPEEVLNPRGWGKDDWKHWTQGDARGVLATLVEAGDPHAAKMLDALGQAKNRHMDLLNKSVAADKGVPSAPYISNTSDWVDLGLKQALIDAARDPGVNRLAWAPGKVQADRYGLEKQIDQLTYGNGRLHAFQNGRVVTNQLVPKERLHEHIGHELAKKLLESPRDNGRYFGLDGVELKTGGEGMKSFYGDMTPEGYQSGIVGTRLQKLVKGLDPEAAKISPHEMKKGAGIRGPDARGRYTVAANGTVQTFPTEAAARSYMGDAQAGDTYPSIPITPAMREKILKEGLPLFNVAALSALLSRILGQGQPNTSEEEN